MNQRKELIVEHVAYLRDTKLFHTSPALNPFKLFLETSTYCSPDDLEAAFTKLVPITTYADYKDLQDSIISGNVDTPNVLFPKLPNYIMNSSSTSGGKSKFFAIHADEDIGVKMLAMQKMKAGRIAEGSVVLEINSISAQNVFGLSVCPGSILAARMALKVKGLPTDEEIAATVDSSNGIPWAIKLVQDYSTLLALHSLFGLVDTRVGYISAVFSSIWLDWAHYIQTHKGELLQCIEFGTLPVACLIEEELQESIMKHWKANPARAQELRGINFNHDGWMKVVWPELQFAEAGCGGVFASGIPRIRSAIGPSVPLVFGPYASTEAMVMGISLQNETDPNLFQMINFGGCLFEYLELNGKLVSGAELKQGQRYKLIVSNKRLGIWRYDLSDVLEHVGFHPGSKNSIMRYIGREGGIRLVPTFISEQEIITAAKSVFDSTNGKVAREFLSFPDSTAGMEAVAFCFEAVDNNHNLDVDHMEDTLTNVLRSQNERFGLFLGDSLRKCAVRVLPPGTFAEYRGWKARSVGSGQVKIPVVVTNLEVRDWFLARCF
ncbi:hypothetical protein BCR33DRAFT_703045 [Rhizoclosmatium globosum]|uniref:GH3 middle domain-containing protein n=1 Tax=Rhizoclosmatium globosum TaxID=329046 RepID=A0A1Y2BAN7_9FUNG|nr:hypothetical protein BCR33DRAFT_703045 [Rhizoclosmatium globosum]|eukprot:ORY31912.1 hypothetical protein BCR33DRAFT_703045 [Rhizoclosmatium globosum]